VAESGKTLAFTSEVVRPLSNATNNKLPQKNHIMKKTLLTTIGLAAVTLAGAHAQTNFYWNGADPNANPAAGGTGVWSTTNAWRTGSDTGPQGTWAAGTTTNNGFLEGTAGTITLGTSGSSNFTGTSLTVNTSGYTITSTNNSRNLVMTGALTTASGVALTLNQNNTGATWGFGSLSLGTGSVLTIQGIATASNANRVNLTGATTSSGGSIVLAGTAAGPTGFVSTSGTSTLSSNITNNSATSATMLGSTSGNALVYSGVLSGSANLQISAGQSGGAGITTLSNVNTYTGNTFLNLATNGVLRIGVDNALPTGTTVNFGASAGGGTADAGGSLDLNGFNLSVGGLQGGNSTRGVANNTGTLSTLTIGKASGSNTFDGAIGTVTNSNLTTQSNNIAVVKTGASSQTFTANNTYAGGTTINAGTLLLTGAGTIGTGNLTMGGGTLDVIGITASTFTMASGTTLSGVGTINATGKTVQVDGILSPGTSPGTLTVNGNLTLSSTAVSNFEINGTTSGLFDSIVGVNSMTFGGTLNLTTGYAAALGDSVQLFSASTYTGTFSSITGTSLGGGLSWSFDAANGTLTVIPEPSTWALLAGGLTVLTILRRRRRNLA
jgi:autotransporter-associated beta strand protein